MDKLEQYLDQVCRRIGGPRALRLHIRQELGEHLRDAVAQHRAAGMSEEAALAKALEVFGSPEDVRSELEAAHGQRLLAVAIDKAIEWKEMTMKAKWLWLTLTHLALVSVIGLAVIWIMFMAIFIVPKFERLMLDGIIDPGILDTQAAWGPAFLNRLKEIVQHPPVWYILILALAWGLFEWRVRSENKTNMRLSALGTVAAALTVVAIIAAASLGISFTLGVPGVGRLARPYALAKIASIDASIFNIKRTLATKDWDAIQDQLYQASQTLDQLSKAAPALHALIPPDMPATVADMRARLKTAQESLREASQSTQEKDMAKLETALARFHSAYDPVQEATKKQLQ